MRRLGCELDLHQRSGVPGGGEILGHDQRHRLPAIQDFVVEQRPERLAGRGDLVLVGCHRHAGMCGRFSCVKTCDHARHGHRRGGVDAR